MFSLKQVYIALFKIIAQIFIVNYHWFKVIDVNSFKIYTLLNVVLLYCVIHNSLCHPNI